MAHKRALVLSGGGAKGAFAAGAIKHLVVERGLAFEIVVGTSTGSLLAPLVVTQDIADLLNIYENVEDQDVLTDRPDLLAFLFSDALSGSEPLEQLINRFVGERGRYHKLVTSSVGLFVTVVNLQTGAVEYGNQHQDSKAVLLKKILASASVPVLMPPIRIGPYTYVDGGVKDIAPFNKAIEEGANHIVAIVLSPDEAHRTPKNKAFTSTMEMAKRTLELLTEEVMDNDVKLASLYSGAIGYLDQIKANARDNLGLTPAQVRRLFSGLESPFEGKRGVGITLIRPDEELAPDSLSFDPVKMREMVDLGYAKAKQVVEEEIATGTGFFKPIEG